MGERQRRLMSIAQTGSIVAFIFHPFIE